MTGEHPLPNIREKEIFWEALKLSTPQDVAAYLNQVCAGDQSLRASVESLLGNHKNDGSDFLLKFPEEIRQSGIRGEKIGDTIDRYKLLKRIGEGGCGIVYLAEQEQPFRRQVALKLIKPGMDFRQVLDRFENERQTLANLNHPSIVNVLDAGDTGPNLGKSPYYVMEYVSGQKITEYADDYRLTIKERLELYLKVCQAVQYAHEKGVFHRDIKPSNILVSGKGGNGLPKIIDFGIAKVIDGNVAKAFATRTGQVVGTPAYMSPEQACLGDEEVDARSDIYSLGVLLYELLVGHHPFNVAGLTTDEVAKKILEENPKSPSNRINEPGDKTYFQIAKRRQVDPSQLEKILKGELDRITMKCLEKKPVDRYATVNDLLSDLDYFLNGAATDAGFDGGNTRRAILKTLCFVGLGIVVVIFVALLIAKIPHIDQPQEVTTPVAPAHVPAQSAPVAPTVSAPVAPAQPQKNEPVNQEFLVNKAIFFKANLAVAAPTFDGALLLLNQIDESAVSDPELASYIAICKEIADFSAKVGIDRKADINFSSIMKNTDLLALARHVVTSPIETFQKANKIKNELPTFDHLQETLNNRYGSE